MVKKKENRGGPRKGAGRKPLINPKQSIALWVEKSRIKSVGGKDAAKKIGEDAIIKQSEDKK